MTHKEQLEEIDKILIEYTQPNSLIDSGNLFYAATTLRDRVRVLTEALEKINDPKRLRDRSCLSSNPPQNAAVWDILNIARKALEDK